MATNYVPKFSHQDYSILQETNVYPGYCRVYQYQLRFRLFNGGWSAPVTRDLMCRPPAVAVLLYDPLQDKVVMIEQLRMGALHQPEGPWLLEIVAGLIDPGETPESTAFREAKEEANCDILSLRHICSYLVSPGISDEVTHVYCGLIHTPEQGGVYGITEDGEDINIHILNATDVLSMLHQGKILSASAVVALQWFALNHLSLRQSQ